MNTDWPEPTRPMPDACWLAPPAILTLCQFYLRQDPVQPAACQAIAARVEEIADTLRHAPRDRVEPWQAKAQREIELAGIRALIVQLRRAIERVKLGTAA